MKNLFFVLVFSITSITLFAQFIPIPKKEKFLADFGNQVITYSKKKKAIKIHYRNVEGNVESHSIDYSKRKGFGKLVRRLRVPTVGGINTPEKALEKLKLYKQDHFVYISLEYVTISGHYTDLSIYDCDKKELTRHKLYSNPEDSQGVSYKFKGTSCVLDRKLFQTFFDGFYYGVVIHDLAIPGNKKEHIVKLPNSIEFKNSGITYIRDIGNSKTSKNFREGTKKRISEISFFKNLNLNLPFVFVSKNDSKYYLTLGSYSIKADDDLWSNSSRRGVLGNSLGTSYSKHNNFFFSILDAETLEHLPNE